MNYDVVVIGGGPAGCASALAFARRGAHALVLEANPKAASRLAGEWLHPTAVELLDELGVDLRTSDYPTGRGFAVFPDDGSEPIVLPYDPSRAGAAIHHEKLVRALRANISAHPSIEYREGARVTDVDGDAVTIGTRDGAVTTVRAPQIVGATGRARALALSAGAESRAVTYSRMAGILLQGVELPFEGYGHLCLGGLGPVLAYRISPRDVRLCLDVPLSFAPERDRFAAFYDAYAPALPEVLRRPLRRALAEGSVDWATNQTLNRACFGRPGFALVGDAVGHHHPLTAIGLTLAFQDAVALSAAPRFDRYRRERSRNSRVPELLAIALYDIFAGTSDEMAHLRRAVYSLWRESAKERGQTMRLLACDDVNAATFARSFTKVLGLSIKGVFARGLETGQFRDAASVAKRLGTSTRGWLASGALHLHEAGSAEEPQSLPARTLSEAPASARALTRGVDALVASQDGDGSWEGECIWCALLSAEYVLAFHIMGVPIPEVRVKRLILHFRRTALPSGLWGLSEVGQPSLFVTTLVYVAARVLGVTPGDPLLASARALFAKEGSVLAIPTWGKFWLALLSLYDWKGVQPVVPELWAMPEAAPVHPSRYYCHTRLIYLAMATLYAERFQTAVTPLTRAIREELFPQGFERADFSKGRTLLRRDDLYDPPSLALRGAYECLRVVDRVRSRKSRRGLLDELRAAIRWELGVSNHTSISPVSGLLNILALWASDPKDPDVERAVERFDCWIWEDDVDGARVTGARSAIWDTSFALQAVVAAEGGERTKAVVEHADRFLAAQQIRSTFPGFAENHRIDPEGGYPFSWVWHGWPVSDCTAEAILARLGANVAGGPTDDDVALAASFILRTQGPDGGFGSYEPKRVPFSLEWLNPAEMFGDSMTEAGYVECTSSCIVALERILTERPHLLSRPELTGIPNAVARGAANIRRQQLPDGSWPGAWGVRLIYGTWFGVRGLLGAGASPTDPAIKKACAWLKSRQRVDGSWGERQEPHATGYVEHADGQVVQTAWALIALSEAEDPDFHVLERAAAFLTNAQLGSGEWPREYPVGLFFRTALLEYALYRRYFPVWGLALFEARRKTRTNAAAPVAEIRAS